MNKWISVKNILPEDGQSVLTDTMGFHDICIYEGTKGWYSIAFKGRTEQVTHWLPLPELPKESE